MNSLEAALNLEFVTYNTGALLTTFTGNVMASGGSGTNGAGLHWDIAPSECTPPYLVAQVMFAPSSQKYGGVVLSEVDVQFKSFAVGRHDAIANLETFISVWDEFIPALIGSGLVTNMQRTAEPVAMKIPAQETSGADEYQAITTYRYTLTP